MDFIELAGARRSIRSFTDKEISKEELDKLLEAARLAPSGGNRQPWHFYVIRNRNVINRIVEESCRQPWIKTASAVIVVCALPDLSGVKYGERGRELYSLQDTAAAVQNILLCAVDSGLGACWCGAFEEEAMSNILSLPDKRRPVALIPIGHPAVSPNMPSRRSAEETVNYID